MGLPPDSGSQGSGDWQSQWQQPQQPPQPGPGGWQQAPDGSWYRAGGPPATNGQATAALVFGILGLVLCPLVCSIVALVLGYQARGAIDRSGGMQSGRGSAIAGIVLGWVGIAIYGALLALIVIGIAAGSSVDSGALS
jgi:hypothetical protein